jgi:hypothetical protein
MSDGNQGKETLPKDGVGLFKIAYLFLSLEGEIDKEGLKKFDMLGEKYSNWDAERGDIIGQCKKILSEVPGQANRLLSILGEINEVAHTSLTESPLLPIIGGLGLGFGLYNLGKPSQSKRKNCLWVLVNLAFYDNQYTANEKQLISNLALKWSIDKSVLSEMEDTAETLIDLDNHRTWIKTTKDSYDYINSVVTELDKNQNELTKNLSEIINIG